MNLPVTMTAVAASLLLLACGERPQVLQSSKSDVPAFQGSADPFAVPGWKAGDRASWEQGLKTRMQNTQNEYTKLPVAK
jgi:hypothetical protein